MATINDNHDNSRDVYVSHKLYLERRAGNRYYNLGYMMYKGMVATGTITVNAANLQNALMNFDIALLFNPNDVDAKARKNDLCDKYGVNGNVTPNLITGPGPGTVIDDARNAAKKEFRNCKC